MNGISSKDLFGAGIRIIGLLSFGRGFADLLYVLLYIFGLTGSSVNTNFPAVSLFQGIFYLLAGIYLLRGAPILVNFAYPKRGKESEAEDLSTPQD